MQDCRNVFTGIIQDVGSIRAAEARGGDLRLVVEAAGLLLAQARVGDSIAVNGVCLTVVEIDGTAFAADVSRETLSLTTLGDCGAGSRVNLEPALRAGDALGGHLVSGHVDGIGEVVDARDDGRSVRVTFRVPAELLRFLARKGSVAVDGVSLTINDVQDDRFAVNLVPHTLDATTFRGLVPGGRVNLEVDTIARYVERLLAAGEPASPARVAREH
jgi:riboflavin synthase